MRKFFLLVTAIFGASVVLAQSDGQLLSLEQAIVMALDHNPAMLATEHSVAAARHNRQAAAGLRFPQINAVGNYSYLGQNISINANNLKQNFAINIGGFVSSALADGLISQHAASLLQGALGAASSLDWSYTIQRRSLGFVGGEVTLPIFLGGKINVANRVALLEESIANEQSEQQQNSLISELIERYYAVALATQVLAARTQAAEGIRRHYDDAVAMEEQGMLARSERLYVEYKLVEAERQRQDAESSLALARSALKNTLAVQEDFLPETAMFVCDSIEPMEYYKSLAKRSNPQLSQVSDEVELAHQAVQLQRSEFFPQVALSAGGTLYEYQITDLLPRWAVGVGVSFKLFDGLNREHKYAAAKQTHQQALLLQEKAESEVSILVESLYNSLINCRNTLISINSSIRFARDYLRMQRVAFGEGWASATDLIDAELELTKSLTQRAEAAYMYDVALARLLEAAGVSERYVEYATGENSRTIKFDYDAEE